MKKFSLLKKSMMASAIAISTMMCSPLSAVTGEEIAKFEAEIGQKMEYCGLRMYLENISDEDWEKHKAIVLGYREKYPAASIEGYDVELRDIPSARILAAVKMAKPLADRVGDMRGWFSLVHDLGTLSSIGLQDAVDRVKETHNVRIVTCAGSLVRSFLKIPTNKQAQKIACMVTEVAKKIYGGDMGYGIAKEFVLALKEMPDDVLTEFLNSNLAPFFPKFESRAPKETIKAFGKIPVDRLKLIVAKAREIHTGLLVNSQDDKMYARLVDALREVPKDRFKEIVNGVLSVSGRSVPEYIDLLRLRSTGVAKSSSSAAGAARHHNSSAVSAGYRVPTVAGAGRLDHDAELEAQSQSQENWNKELLEELNRTKAALAQAKEKHKTEIASLQAYYERQISLLVEAFGAERRERMAWTQAGRSELNVGAAEFQPAVVVSATAAEIATEVVAVAGAGAVVEDNPSSSEDESDEDPIAAPSREVSVGVTVTDVPNPGRVRPDHTLAEIVRGVGAHLPAAGGAGDSNAGRAGCTMLSVSAASEGVEWPSLPIATARRRVDVPVPAARARGVPRRGGDDNIVVPRTSRR